MNRTQIVCLLEGTKDSADLIFANAFLHAFDPQWLRPYSAQKFRSVTCGGRNNVIDRFPIELKICAHQGADTTLIVFADVDDDENGEILKRRFKKRADEAGIEDELFRKAVFILPKDRIENWIQFLNTGSTDELVEGPREKKVDKIKEAARKLAKICKTQSHVENIPPSLSWSCVNWNELKDRMAET